MAFLSGSVSFSRFRIAGGGPKRLDENLLEKFRQHRIGADRVAHADHVEVGWIGGRHLLDLDFEIEKNVLLDCLHLGMRIDSARIPPDLMRAYMQQEFEALLREGGGGGRNQGRLKRQAKDSAAKRAEQEIKQGRYRSFRQFPVLIDSRHDVIYFGATSPAVHERLHQLFRDTFSKRLDAMTAGQRAMDWAEEKGVSRKLENLSPTLFVDPTDGGQAEVYWTAHDPHSCDFLGNEFMLWLWFQTAERGDTMKLEDGSEAALIFVKQLALECPRAETGKEVITCDGPTTLPEARRAIQAGKLPRKAGLTVNRQGEQYTFVLQAETFGVSGAVLPKVEDRLGNDDAESGKSVGGGQLRAEERVEQVRHLSATIDAIYAQFLKVRFGSDWRNETEAIRAWLRKK